MVFRSIFSNEEAVSRAVSAASEATSRAWPYMSCAAPLTCFATPAAWVLVSPVKRPNPSSIFPPIFLAVPLTRFSSMAHPLLVKAADSGTVASDGGSGVLILRGVTGRLLSKSGQPNKVPACFEDFHGLDWCLLRRNSSQGCVAPLLI